MIIKRKNKKLNTVTIKKLFMNMKNLKKKK